MPARKYKVILSEETYSKVGDYVSHLNDGGSRGAYLAQKLRGQQLSNEILLSTLLQTKQPQIFAESAVLGNGDDWTHEELSILGDISIAMTVKIFDNGAHQKPQIHSEAFEGHLIYTPGALLRNDQGYIPADWSSVTTDEQYDRHKYQKLYERRLRPVFQYISETAIARGRPAFITIPGLGCGQFAGPFRGQMGHLFQAALIKILENHGHGFLGIKSIYYDPYNECVDLEKTINGIRFFVRPLTPDNEGKTQLCQPEILIPHQLGDFSECELYSIVAWDHVSWPGNDYYLGQRVTDDGVKAAATDTMYKMTGVEGTYSAFEKKYIPPAPYGNWKQVVDENDLELDFSAGLYIL